MIKINVKFNYRLVSPNISVLVILICLDYFEAIYLQCCIFTYILIFFLKCVYCISSAYMVLK